MRTKVQHGANAGENTRPVFKIETVEDYECAKRRIEGLRDSTRGDDEEHELQALVEAVQRWDADHSVPAGRQGRKTS